MFLSQNNKSILLATAIALGCYGVAHAQSETKEVTINFEALVGDNEFACGESYEEVGTANSTITPTDFRFYVSDLALIDEDGNAVSVDLEQDGKWQYQNVALLDFEDGTNVCDNGTAETRTMVVGTVPEGNYQNLQFNLGVPKQLNHEDAAIAPSPLNLTSMWWNWQGGYKFLRTELKNDQAIANRSSTSQTTSSHGSVQTHQHSTSNHGGSQTTVQTSSQSSISNQGKSTHHQASSIHNSHGNSASNTSYLIHLGSTGCQDSAQSNLFNCANPNRANIVLEDFDPEDNVVVADLAQLLAETDLSTNQANTPVGCMSSPEDSDCSAIMQNLGLSFNGNSAEDQKFFGIK